MANEVQRSENRPAHALRPVSIDLGPMKFAEGSALIKMGDTHVLVAASIESRVPPFLIDSGKGWATAEYAMLPRATSTRSRREVTRGRPSGRSSEIQRLIGRSLRAVLDLKAMAGHTLLIDCDVLQADGGTRTASITGAYVAAAQALARFYLMGDLARWPLTDQVAAISAGLVGGVGLLDLDAPEDQNAEADFNLVGTASGNLIEVQGTGEQRSYSRDELDAVLDLALAGIQELCEYQRQILAPILEEVEALKGKGKRSVAPPRDEKDLWGAP